MDMCLLSNTLIMVPVIMAVKSRDTHCHKQVINNSKAGQLLINIQYAMPQNHSYLSTRNFLFHNNNGGFLTTVKSIQFFYSKFVLFLFES